MSTRRETITTRTGTDNELISIDRVRIQKRRANLLTALVGSEFKWRDVRLTIKNAIMGPCEYGWWRSVGLDTRTINMKKEN
jgi:hypothetical protein